MLRKLKPRLSLLLLTIAAATLIAFSLQGGPGCTYNCTANYQNQLAICHQDLLECESSCNGNPTCIVGCEHTDNACVQNAVVDNDSCQACCKNPNCGGGGGQ